MMISKKTKPVLNDKKIKINLAPYDEEASYREYIYARYTPCRLLKEKYPTFYKDFKRKFDNLFKVWEISANLKGSISKSFKSELFLKYCILIKALIQSESKYEEVLIELENNSKLKTEKKRYNQPLKMFNDIVESLFTLPDILVFSFTKDIKKVKELLDTWENKYTTYPKEIFETALNIQNKNKGKRPKITNEDAIILANDKKGFFKKNELIDEYGLRTKLLWDIKRSYENHHKNRLTKRNI